MVKEIESLDELTKVFEEAGSKVVLVDFYATWCGPCKIIAPKLEALSKATPTMVVIKVDVDRAPDVSERYEIEAMPTFKVFRNGEEIETVIGGDASKVEALFTKYK